MSKKIHDLQRLANVPSATALAEIKRRYPKGDLVDFSRKGKYYVAKIAMDDIEPIDVPPAADPGPELDSFEPESDEPADHMEEEMDDLSDIKSLLEQVAEAVGVSTGMDETDDEIVLDGDDLGDIPPPVEEGDDMDVFASVKGKRHFTAERQVEAGLTDGQIVREAAAKLPNHEVVQIDRRVASDEGKILVLMRHKG